MLAQGFLKELRTLSSEITSVDLVISVQLKNGREKNYWRYMAHRYLADSIEGVVQLLAASYLRHGYYWYMTGSIPKEKSAASVDQKLIRKYDIDVSKWEQSRRKKNGIANAQYLRYGSWFVVLVTEGHHKIKAPSQQGGDAENLRDCRRIPIRCHGLSLDR